MILCLLILFDKKYSIKRDGNAFILYNEYMGSFFIHTFYIKGDGKYEYINSVFQLGEDGLFMSHYDDEIKKLVSIFFEVRRFYYKELFDMMLSKSIDFVECETEI